MVGISTWTESELRGPVSMVLRNTPRRDMSRQDDGPPKTSRETQRGKPEDQLTPQRPRRRRRTTDGPTGHGRRQSRLHHSRRRPALAPQSGFVIDGKASFAARLYTVGVAWSSLRSRVRWKPKKPSQKWFMQRGRKCALFHSAVTTASLNPAIPPFRTIPIQSQNNE